VKAAVGKSAGPADIVMPGHIFPLIAQPGGVLTRAGHTEAGCDLARMTGYEPASVIVEVMNEDGTMAKRPELEAFAEKHGIKLGTIADLIQYRTLHDKTISLADEKMVSTIHGEFRLRTYTDTVSDAVHYAFCKGDIEEDNAVPVRVQTLNKLRDVFGTVRPNETSSWSIAGSLSKIEQEGCGVVVLVGHDLTSAEELDQAIRFPEVPSPERAGDGSQVYRVIGTGSQILRDVGVGKMRLLSSPVRYNALSGFHLEVVEFVEPE